MEEYELVCTDCGQRIAVNGPMREAIARHGCPVCAACGDRVLSLSR
ncbi:MAG: zinc ribbon domain-containing protein [Halolamina sp.]